MPPMDGKHLALVGFMGAGKSTLGWQLAARIGAPLTDVDADLEGLVGPIPDYFGKHGEAAFRVVEESAVTEALLRRARPVVVLGRGAVPPAAPPQPPPDPPATPRPDVDGGARWGRGPRRRRPPA